MKRLHIHVGVKELAPSIRFYSALFGAEPIKTKDDYAKWLLDDPHINFAISTHAEEGINHLGLQVQHDDELEELRSRLKGADQTLFDEGEEDCCYARSEKSWVKDPSGVAWEAYRTMGEANVFERIPVASASSQASSKASREGHGTKS